MQTWLQFRSLLVLSCGSLPEIWNPTCHSQETLFVLQRTTAMTSARTNLGPLSSFTYPASCSVVVQDCSTCTYGWQGQSCGTNKFNTQGVQDNLDCWPPRGNDNISSGVAVNGWGFYSPGIDCPVGYVTACASTPGAEGGFPFQFSILARETAIGCCPSGYSCSYNPGIDKAQTCYKYWSTGSFPTVQCSSGTSNKFSYVTIPATVAATITPTTTGGVLTRTTVVINNVLVMAPLFQLNYQASDRITASITTATSSPSNSATSQAAESSTGLSQGASIGIGVGGAVIFLIFIGALVLWIRKRKRRPRVMPVLPPDPQKPQEMGSLMMYVAEAPTESDAHEVDALPKGGTYRPYHEEPTAGRDARYELQ